MAESSGSTRPESEWNGRDWYVNFGERSPSRNWDDGRRYGFVVDGRPVPFRSLDLKAPYIHESEGTDPHEDHREWIVPVQWTHTVAREDAFRIPGLFANQNSACRLRHRFTVDTVTSFFESDPDRESDSALA